MVKFRELRDDSAAFCGDLDQMRMQLGMAEKGYMIPATGEEGEALPPHLAGFKSTEDFTIRQKTLDYGNGEVYKGDTLGKLRHGRGVHTCANGDRYEGRWRYDKRDGTGKMTFVRGVKYEGNWKDDKAHGNGAAQYENGGVYVGEFREDHRWGWGTHYFPSGDKYEGEWEDDKISGQGRMTFQDGSYYEGQWLEGERVKGKLVEGGGASEYTGTWKGGMRHGYGVQFTRGMFKYMGQWEADMKEGEGKCVYADGRQYDGQWKAGFKHGRGRLSSGNQRYDGEWQRDACHGTGNQQTAAGDRYKGEFVDGKRHGRGICVYVDGSKYEGEWQDNQRHGKGTCLFANGDKYKGSWQQDKRQGYGMCKFKDGRKFRGEWDDDGWVQSAADPQNCRLAGPGITKAMAGKKAEFAIEARDDNGCLRLSGGDEFQAALLGPARVTVDVKDHADGTYSASYAATVAGVYELHITLGLKEHVAQSPYPLRVLPAAPCVKRCRVEGGGRCGAVAGVAAHFEVEACDEFGNRWSGDAEQLLEMLPLEASLSNGMVEAEVQVEAHRDGWFRCSYTAPEAGYWRLHVSCNGQPLPRTPFSVHVVQPAAAAAAVLASSHPQCSAVDAKAGASSGDGCARPDGEPSSGSSQLATVPLTPALPPPGPPVRDEMSSWARIAAEAFAADGSTEGWDSDAERKESKKTKEQEYIEAHPDVPVVENLEDLWLVSKLQNERKAKEERQKQKKLQAMHSQLEEVFGAPEAINPEEVAKEARAMMTQDVIQQMERKLMKDKGAAASKLAAAAAARVGRMPAARGGRARLQAAASALSQLD